MRNMMKKRLLLFFVCLLSLFDVMADITVTGVVTSSEDKEPVIGASVLEKGTTNGTITDYDGNYTLTVKENAVLVISYVGMRTREVKVSSNKHDVVLSSDAIAIGDVVVTAMGVVQEKKRMNFAVQSVDADALTMGKNANVLESLQGLVPGASITTGGGSPNSGSQIIIRGVSSMSMSNEPLVVVDGMVVTGGVGDLNPNDIENITVLKGAAASALYGMDAQGGVLMITTRRAKEGKLSAKVNATWQFDTPANLIELQNKYIPGSNGFYREQTKNGWGPLLADGEKTYDNVRNYFNDFGFYHKYDISLTGGTEKVQTTASASYSKNDGIVPNDYRQKITALIKGEYIPNKYIKMGLSANIINQQYRGAGSVSGIYSWPINDDITNYKTESGDIRFLYFADEKTGSPISPLWSRYADYGENKSTRMLINGHITATPVKGLNLTARIALDRNNYTYDGYSVPRFSDTNVVPDTQKTDDLATFLTHPYLTVSQLDKIDKSLLGSYSNSSSVSNLLTASFLATYHVDLPKDFGLDALFGAEMKQRKSLANSISGNDFVVPGVYSVANLAEIKGTSDVAVTHSERRNASVYYELRADYKGIASLSTTGRWDWSSTLRWEVQPFAYFSATAGLTFSELFPSLKESDNNWFSFGKLRANYAGVGRDCSPYLFDRRFAQYPTLPDGGYSVNPSFSVAADNLVPEHTDSWEVGLDLRFFNNRTRLDAAYYGSITDNQIVTVRVSHTTGYVLQTRNEGTVRNQGMEISLSQDIIKRNDWLWTATLNLSFNRTKVLHLPDNVTELQGTQYTDIFPSAFLHGSTTSLTGKDYLRTENGDIICDADGYPQINPTKQVLIGNREPKLMLGLSTSLTYKGWSLNALFDARIGGDVANVTGRSILSGGMSKMLEQYRGRQVVWNGVVLQNDGTYVKNTQPITLDATTLTNYYYTVSSNFIEDGSYLRMSYLTLSYDFSDMLKQVRGIEGIKLSLTGNNLFLLTRYSGGDPRINANTSASGTGSAGIDYYPVPSTRSYSLSFQMTF